MAEPEDWGGSRLSQSPSHDFRFWCARSSLVPSALGLFGIFGLFLGFLPFSVFFLSCLYIVPLPKILASRLVASLGEGGGIDFNSMLK